MKKSSQSTYGRGKTAIAKFGGDAADGVIELKLKNKNTPKELKNKPKVVEVREEPLSPEGIVKIQTADGKTPLYVINGIEASGEFDLEPILPDLIESVSVLKGPAAIEKYGEKGKNGVVEIITKSESFTKRNREDSGDQRSA